MSGTSDYKTRVYGVLHSVPLGSVVTYGQLANLSGIVNGARVVAKILRDLPRDTNIPWHRVVNASGRISLPEPGGSLQRERLEQEGVNLVSGRINLNQYQWSP